MTSKKVLRYYCVCGRGFWKKEKCLQHEKTCWGNPANRTCKTCRHGLQGDDEDDRYSGTAYACFNDDYWTEHSRHTGPEKVAKYLSVNCPGWGGEDSK